MSELEKICPYIQKPCIGKLCHAYSDSPGFTVQKLTFCELLRKVTRKEK